MTTILFNNTPFQITDELRKEYLDSCCVEGTDEEVYIFFVDKFEDLFENLQYVKDKKGEKINNVPVIITGKLNLWDGEHAIEPKIAINIKSTMRLCCKKCDYCKIYKEFSKIIIEATHHDGTNVFTLQFLNNDGETRFLNGADVDLTNKRYIRTLGKYLY